MLIRGYFFVTTSARDTRGRLGIVRARVVAAGRILGGGSHRPSLSDNAVSNSVCVLGFFLFFGVILVLFFPSTLASGDTAVPPQRPVHGTPTLIGPFTCSFAFSENGPIQDKGPFSPPATTSNGCYFPPSNSVPPGRSCFLHLHRSFTELFRAE